MKIRKHQANLFVLSMIPAAIMIVATILSIYFLPGVNNVQVTLNEDYIQQVESESFEISQSYEDLYTEYFANFHNTMNLIESIEENGRELNNASGRPNYSTDLLAGLQTPSYEFSLKHNGTVDKSVSSFSLYENATLTSAINNSLALTADLEFMLPSIYESNPNLLWIELYMEEGYKRTYPFMTDTQSLNRTSELAYQGALTTTDGEIYVTSPYVDRLTNQAIISIALPIYRIINQLESVIVFDILIKDIQETLASNEESNFDLFISFNDGLLLAHSKFVEPVSGWNETNVIVNIIDIEGNSTELLDAINQAGNGTEYHDKLVLGDDELLHVLNLVPIQGTPLIFGLDHKLQAEEVIGTFTFESLWLLPIIVVSTFTFIGTIVLRRWGSMKGFKVEDINVDGIIGKLENIKEFADADSLTKLAQKKIEDTGEELRDKVKGEFDKKKDGIIDKVLTEVDQLDERIDDAFDKLDEKSAAFDKKLVKTVDKTLDKAENLANKMQNDPTGFINETMDKLNIDPQKIDAFLDSKGIDAKELLEGDLSSLTNLASEEQIAIVLGKVEKINVSQVSSLIGIPRSQLENYIKSVDPAFGITLNGNNLEIDQNKLGPNINIVSQDLVKLTKSEI